MKKITEFFYLSERGEAYIGKKDNLKLFKNGGLIIRPKLVYWNGKIRCRIENLEKKPDIILDGNNVLEMITASGVSSDGIINDKFTLEFSNYPCLVSESNSQEHIERIRSYTKMIRGGKKSKKIIPGHLYGTGRSYFICLGNKLSGCAVKKRSGYFDYLSYWSSHYDLGIFNEFEQTPTDWDFILELSETALEFVPRNISKLSSTALSMLYWQGSNPQLKYTGVYDRKAVDLGEVYSIENIPQLLKDVISMNLSKGSETKENSEATTYRASLYYDRTLYCCLLYCVLVPDPSQLKDIPGLKQYIETNCRSKYGFDKWIKDRL